MIIGNFWDPDDQLESDLITDDSLDYIYSNHHKNVFCEHSANEIIDEIEPQSIKYRWINVNFCPECCRRFWDSDKINKEESELHRIFWSEFWNSDG